MHQTARMINNQIWEWLKYYQKIECSRYVEIHMHTSVCQIYVYIERMSPYGFVLISIAFDENVWHIVCVHWMCTGAYIACNTVSLEKNDMVWCYMNVAKSKRRNAIKENRKAIISIICPNVKNDGRMPLSFISLYQLSITWNPPCQPTIATVSYWYFCLYIYACIWTRSQSQRMTKVSDIIYNRLCICGCAQ